MTDKSTIAGTAVVLSLVLLAWSILRMGRGN
jgi:hypothetical protein